MPKLAGSLLAVLVLAPLSITHANVIVVGGIEVQDHVAGSPFEREQQVELDSIHDSGMLDSVIPTVPGGSYRFRFADSPRPGHGADDDTILVFLEGALLATLSRSGVALSNTGWSVFDFLVVASSHSSSIEHRAAGARNSFGGYLDAVSFVARNVPEPSTVAILALGLLSLRLRRRDR